MRLLNIIINNSRTFSTVDIVRVVLVIVFECITNKNIANDEK